MRPDWRRLRQELVLGLEIGAVDGFIALNGGVAPGPGHPLRQTPVIHRSLLSRLATLPANGRLRR